MFVEYKGEYKMIGDRVKRRRLELGMSQDELAKRMGYKSRSSINKLELNENDLPQTKVVLLSKILNVPIGYLMEDDLVQEIKIIYNDYFPLKYRTNLSAGSFDEIMDSEPDAVVYVPIKFQAKKEQLRAFKVNGTSMDNVIPDKSIVVTEQVGNALDIKDGTIVAAWYEGTATVKRFYKSGNIVTLMPDSLDRNHQPIMINTEIAPVQIIGRVIWHMNPDSIQEKY